jgi:hypothetical protein
MKSIFNRQLLSPLVFMLLGLLFFAIGSGMTIHQRALEKQGLETQGVVIDLQEHSDSDGSAYAPVVRFKTADGYNVEFVSSYSSNPPAHEVGELVTVVYSTSDPGQAVIKGEGQLVHIIFMLSGGAVAIVGFYLVLSTFRNMALISPGE